MKIQYFFADKKIRYIAPTNAPNHPDLLLDKIKIHNTENDKRILNDFTHKYLLFINGNRNIKIAAHRIPYMLELSSKRLINFIS